MCIRDRGNCKQPLIPIKDNIIYELHVRGFTKDASSGVSHPGTFAGLMEKIPYLKELGKMCIRDRPGTVHYQPFPPVPVYL